MRPEEILPGLVVFEAAKTDKTKALAGKRLRQRSRFLRCAARKNASSSGRNDRFSR